MPFLPAYQIVATEDAIPRYSAILLHGILGSGQNLRSFARRLVQACPAWQILLVDHRNHGDSGHPSGPQTVNRCAGDIFALCQSLTLKPQLIAGHSFGGKVALAYARNQPNGLRQAWILDTNPGSLDPSKRAYHVVSRVLETVASVPMPLEHRNDLVEHFRHHGLPEAVARWMTTNLRRTDGGLQWRFHYEALGEMIHDYWDTDLWSFLKAPPDHLSIDLVQAERSDRWDLDSVKHIEALPAYGNTQVHLLENAGHWLHVDNPDGLIELMLPSLQDSQE
jgi:pimeloyl-ACP methyl ester carboxylesterase